MRGHLVEDTVASSPQFHKDSGFLVNLLIKNSFKKNFYGFYICSLSLLQEEMGATVFLHKVPPHAVEVKRG